MKASLSQLLVHLDATPQTAWRLRLACTLAQAHGASVTGLFAVTSAFVVLPFAAEGAVVTLLRDVDSDRRRAARAMFDQQAGSVKLTWAQTVNEPAMEVFAQQALYTDLMILGQQNPDASQSSGVPSDFAQNVMADSGTAALIVPYTAAPTRVGDTIMIAWKPTPQSRRAVDASMPLLRQARHVHVVSWTQEDEPVDGSSLDLRGYLLKHGVEASWHCQTQEPENAGELLLSQASDLGADLLVMGCYGHSRAREWMLGGASRTVLRSMTLPVLMSH